MLAWHFLQENRRMQWGSKAKVEAGKMYRVKPPLVMCKHGLHGSEKPLDALRYAPGPIVCRVELGGEILHDTDKACATERKVLWMADATRTLHEFAVWCAARALRKEFQAGRKPDPRSYAALRVKRKWLKGEITDRELAAARAAAWDAARDAAWAAAGATARAAARDAARAAAGAAAWATARDAARAAARAAAWAAARAAAWAASWAAQNRKLTRMLMTLTKETK